MEKKKIFILGNPFLNLDSLPVKLAKKLKQLFPNFEFIHLDPTEGFPNLEDASPIFIDTVQGIEKVTIFTDLSCFSSSPRNTVHDYDLFVNLSILNKLGKLSQITIIGVPHKGNLKKIEKEVCKIIKASAL